MQERNYHDQLNIENTEKLRELVKSLPKFAASFFRGIEPTTSSKTRIAYAYDLGIFFDFIKEANPLFKDIEVRNIQMEILDQIIATDIEEYLEYLSFYKKNGVEHTNNERGKMRKLASLRTFYKYYFKKELILTNPPSIVDMPKLHQKEIIRLDIDEVALLLDQVEQGDKLTEREKHYHAKTKIRDLALLTLLLGTGIRVSECVGLDIDDVDFKNLGIKILRKGGTESIVYFGDEVEEALLSYLDERKKIIPETGHENALFLSMQKKRLNVRSVENLVKKYSKLITHLKNITPHKLRSTYGTSLYRETGDIYLVADVLGHSDVNTTRKHYAALEDQRKRSARNKVTLRESK
ncbi:MAG: tyrosine-type recombinase/integrase [Clostridiales bacterium]|nr:tyrosine-type recombinase/integrase [Clostridiales bacterium]